MSLLSTESVFLIFFGASIVNFEHVNVGFDIKVRIELVYIILSKKGSHISHFKARRHKGILELTFGLLLPRRIHFQSLPSKHLPVQSQHFEP